jgi:2-oxo-4-hydroxy-4-carboxy-5-ureidoimidazoline decarboxylase
MTIEELNSLDCAGFINAVGWVFEGSPWVAERAWKNRIFKDVDSLHQAMIEQVKAASREEQLALLRAHPDLGTRARVTAASSAEQTAAGLHNLTPPEFDHLQRLNTEYRDKFGFPFLFAVKGSTRRDILRALEQRLGDAPEQEYREALRHVYRIARFRIEDIVK